MREAGRCRPRFLYQAFLNFEYFEDEGSISNFRFFRSQILQGGREGDPPMPRLCTWTLRGRVAKGAVKQHLRRCAAALFDHYPELSSFGVVAVMRGVGV